MCQCDEQIIYNQIISICCTESVDCHIENVLITIISINCWHCFAQRG